jgi:glutathione S-transferase
MAIKFHRCKNEWVKMGSHPCWRVQKALDEAQVEYEIVHEHPTFARSKRENTIKRTGQQALPWIEFEDGSVYREESKDMAEAIAAGKLEEKRGGTAGDAVTPGAS